MKKIAAAFGILFFTSTTFALSCMPSEPLPPLEESINQYKTIGLLEIIEFKNEGLIDQKNNKFPDKTAEGKPRKYTIHSVKWKSLKKGSQTSETFSLRINATSWMGYSNKFEPGTILPLTTKSAVKDELLTLDQDFGCYFNDWEMYSIEDITSLHEVKKINKKNFTPKISTENKTFWEKMLSWFSNIFKN